MELQGRVFSINTMLVSLFRPCAFALTPIICDNLFTPFMEGNSSVAQGIRAIIGSTGLRGVALFIIIVGAVLLVWSIGGMNYRPLRKMEDYLPDAIPGAVIYADKDRMQEVLDKQIE